jgi:dCMP deaminase
MPGATPSPTYDDCPSAHAEANAIARADYSRMQGATLYVSTSCCKGCAKLLANSGIVRVVYRHEAGRDYRNIEETVAFLEECGIEVVAV